MLCKNIFFFYICPSSHREPEERASHRPGSSVVVSSKPRPRRALEQSSSSLSRPPQSARRRNPPPRTLLPLVPSSSQSSTGGYLDEVVRGTRLWVKTSLTHEFSHGVEGLNSIVKRSERVLLSNSKRGEPGDIGLWELSDQCCCLVILKLQVRAQVASGRASGQCLDKNNCKIFHASLQPKENKRTRWWSWATASNCSDYKFFTEKLVIFFHLLNQTL